MSGTRRLLLAQELAIVATRPRTGRPSVGTRYALNACLAGLLVAELELEDRPAHSGLDAAAAVVADKGPKVTAILSHMDRGLRQDVGLGTWDAVTAELPGDPGVHIEIVHRLRTAAGHDERLELRTALLLSFTGPAKLLEVVAANRGSGGTLATASTERWPARRSNRLRSPFAASSPSKRPRPSSASRWQEP